MRIRAASRRARAENVIVIAEGADGLIGLGEGCPGSSVTGETVAGALEAIARWRKDGIEMVADLAALTIWTERRRAAIDANSSAFAAVEIALIDLFARAAGSTIEQLLGVASVDTTLRATAVYGPGSKPAFLLQAALYNLNGMRNAKLKLSGDAEHDRDRARFLARLGPLRLDAGNLWASADDAVGALEPLRSYAWAVEEPLRLPEWYRQRDWKGLAAIGARTGLSIILDGSVTRQENLAHLEAGPHYILNARVSKHGGLMRTLATIRQARARGVKIIVGAEVGESSILARAGILAARAAGPDLVAFEGGFGPRLLARDAATPSVRLRYGGRLAHGSGHGLGLTPTPEVVSACR